MSKEQLVILQNWLLLINDSVPPTWRELLQARRNTLYEAWHGGMVNHSQKGTIVIYGDASYTTYGLPG